MQGIDLRMQRSQILVIGNHIIGMAQPLLALGLGLLVAGAAGMVTTVSANWNIIKEKLVSRKI